MPNYATKSDLKNGTPVHTSQFAKRDDLANVNSEVHRLDNYKLSELNADQLKPVPNDLSKLNFATNTSLNAKTNEVKNEIPSFSNLATNSALKAKK